MTYGNRLMIEEFRVRTNLPKRSDVAPRNSYREYRAELRHDFFGSCGYCGDDDERVDRITFHIDHFAPKSVFPDLALSYGNLVYACRFCNVGKSNHWIGSDPATSRANQKSPPTLTRKSAGPERALGKKGIWARMITTYCSENLIPVRTRQTIGNYAAISQLLQCDNRKLSAHSPLR